MQTILNLLIVLAVIVIIGLILFSAFVTTLAMYIMIKTVGAIFKNIKH